MFDNNCECNKDKYKLPNGCFLMGPTGPTARCNKSSIYIFKW